MTFLPKSLNMRFKNLFTLTGFKIGILATIVSLIIYIIGIPFLRMVELKAFDLHFLSRDKIQPGSDVVIVAIDEKSLDRFGRWPWPRKRIAELTDKLKKAGAKVVAFDIIFSEPDESSGINVIKSIKGRLKKKDAEAVSVVEAIEKDADNDMRLAAAVKGNPSVVLGYFFFTSQDDIKHRGNTSSTAGSKSIPEPASYIKSSRYSLVRYLEKNAPQPKLLNAIGVQENIAVISKAANSFGYFNILPDLEDGIVRWVPLAIKYGEDIYPHLSLEAVRKFLGSPPLILNVAGYGVDSIQIGNKTVPTDERGRILVNFRGPQKTFPYYSFSDVIDGQVPGDALKDKIVLVGATATGIYDMRATPLGGTFPGIEIHANIIDTILRDDYIHRPDWIVVFDILAILMLGIALSIAIPKVRPLYTALSAIGFIVFYIILNNYIFNHWKMWLTEVYPIFTIIAVFGSAITFQFMTEEKKKKEIRDAFSRYVSPSLVGEILKDPKRLVLGGEEKRLTVLFSDIRGFTSISETLKPQVLVKLMNDYLTPMTDIVLKNGGTIDKYMGDAIMAFWGAPVWQDDHAHRACRAALEMLEKLSELQMVWGKSGLPKLDIGIGISTGKVTVGNMGSTTRFDYTVMGDTVNLGSRLEGLNKEYGTHIIVPKYTYDDIEESKGDQRERKRRDLSSWSAKALEQRFLKDRRAESSAPKGEFLLRQLDMLKVKGKDSPIKVYELLEKKSDASNLKEIVELFEAGLELYRKKEWDRAEACFQNVLKLKADDGPSKTFLFRIKELRETELPSGWDGVFVMKKK